MFVIGSSIARHGMCVFALVRWMMVEGVGKTQAEVPNHRDDIDR